MFYPNTAKTIFIPAGTINIKADMFSKEDRATTAAVVIPNSVISIEDGALKNFIRMTHINFERAINLAHIGKEAFSGCMGLKAIYLPGKVETIDELAFANLPELEKVIITSNLKYLADNAFSGCHKLRKVSANFNADSYTKTVLKRLIRGAGELQYYNNPRDKKFKCVDLPGWKPGHRNAVCLALIKKAVNKQLISIWHNPNAMKELAVDFNISIAELKYQIRHLLNNQVIVVNTGEVIPEKSKQEVQEIEDNITVVIKIREKDGRKIKYKGQIRARAKYNDDGSPKQRFCFDKKLVQYLINTGIMPISTVYEQMTMVLLNKYIGPKEMEASLKMFLSENGRENDICQVFEALADAWILHDGFIVGHKDKDEEILSVIRKFVDTNKVLVENKFLYNFQVRGTRNDWQTKGKSISEVREDQRRGDLVGNGGDTIKDSFKSNEETINSQEYHESMSRFMSGYNSADFLGFLIARIFNGGLISNTVKTAIGAEITDAQVKPYLKHRGNTLLLENLIQAERLNRVFFEELNYLAGLTARQAFKRLFDYLSANKSHLTEEGKAVVNFIEYNIKSILWCDGEYLKEGGKVKGRYPDGTDIVVFDKIVTYDQLFDTQYEYFLYYMGMLDVAPGQDANISSVPSILKAFLSDTMYGAGRREVVTDIGFVEDLDVVTAAIFDESFMEQKEKYEHYNKGALNAAKADEDERLERVAHAKEPNIDDLVDSEGEPLNACGIWF